MGCHKIDIHGFLILLDLLAKHKYKLLTEIHILVAAFIDAFLRPSLDCTNTWIDLRQSHRVCTSGVPLYDWY